MDSPGFRDARTHLKIDCGRADRGIDTLSYDDERKGISPSGQTQDLNRNRDHKSEPGSKSSQHVIIALTESPPQQRSGEISGTLAQQTFVGKSFMQILFESMSR